MDERDRSNVEPGLADEPEPRRTRGQPAHVLVELGVHRPASWSADAWEFLVTDRTERLVRSAEFRSLHQRVVTALEEMGDLGVLSGDELRQVLVTEDAESLA